MTKNTPTNYQNKASTEANSINNRPHLTDTTTEMSAIHSDSVIHNPASESDIATFGHGMAQHLKTWLAALHQARDLLPPHLHFNEVSTAITDALDQQDHQTNQSESMVGSHGEVSLTLIEQLETLPVFALTVVVQRQALGPAISSSTNLQAANDSTSTLATTAEITKSKQSDFESHIADWAAQNPSWKMIKVTQATTPLPAQKLSHTHRITPVLVYHYILLPSAASRMQSSKKAAAAHLLDDSITAHLRQFIDTLPITVDMGGDAAIDCHIVSLAKILRPHRVICFDMDSTLIEQEVINELAKHAGIGEQVSAITESAMRGEIDFDTSFSERVSLLQNLSTTVLDEIQETLTISAGAAPLVSKLKALGYHTVLVSGGFTYFADRIAKTLSIDEVHANILDIEDGVVTGDVLLPIVNGERKALLVQQIAKRFNISPAQVVCVGDGANDLPMMAVADLGIAYHAKPIVRARADAALNATGLEGVFYVLGYSPNDLNSKQVDGNV